jgi:hypothetical protein
MGLILTLVLNDKQNIMLTTECLRIVLTVIVLIVAVLSVVMLSVIMVNVVAPSINTLFFK